MLLENALSETGPWLRDGRIQRPSFDVSPAELLDHCFSSAIMEACSKAEVEPRHLILEMTDGAVVQNFDLAARVMTRLGARGITFALKDFGCGYSDMPVIRSFRSQS